MLNLHLRPDLLEEALDEELEAGPGTPGCPVFAGHHLSLPALLENAFAEEPGRGRPARLSPLGEALLLDRVAAEARGPLAGLGAAPGLRRALSRVFQAAAVAGVGPPMLERAARRMGAPEQVLEVARLYGRYRALLGTRFADDAAAFRRAAAALGKSLPAELAGAALEVHGLALLPPGATLPTLHGWFTVFAALLTGDPDPTGAEVASQGPPRPAVRVLLPAVEGRPLLEAALAPLLSTLYRHHESNLEEGRVPLRPPMAASPEAASPEDRLIGALFAPDRALAKGELPPDRLTLRPAPTPAAEARGVARAVRDRLDSGAAPGTLVVVAQDPSRRARLHAALLRYGVPVHVACVAPSVDRGSSGYAGPGLAVVGQAPPVQALLLLYGLRDQGVPREALIQILSTRYVRFFHDRAPPWKVARALREAGVRDLRPQDARHRRRAPRPIAAPEGELDYRRRLGEWLRQQPEGTGAAAIVTAVDTALHHLSALPESAPLSVHAQALSRLCEQLHLAELSREPAGGPRSGEVPSCLDEDAALSRDQEAVAVLLDVLAELPRQEARLFGATKDPMSRERFARLLSGMLLNTPLSQRGAPGAAVLLCDLAAACVRRPAHLFLAGLIEGEFPVYPQEDTLLPDEDRRGLNRILGRDVFPLAQGEGALSPLLFTLALARSGAAHLSWPLSDDDGRSLLRSAYVDEAIRAAALPEPPRPCDEQAVVPPASEARCPTELWTRAALSGYAEQRLVLSRTYGGADRGAFGRALLDALARKDPPRAARLFSLIEIERERARWFAARLLEDPAAIARASGPGPYTGRLLMNDPALRQALAEKLPGSPAHPLSASALEDYAKCPFRFFVRRVLKAAPVREGGDDLDPLAGGRLHHAVLDVFFKERLAAERLPLRGDDGDLLALDQAVDQVLSDWPKKERQGHRDLFAVRVRRLREDLRRLVLREARQPVKEGCVPRLFEHEFGPLSITSQSDPDGGLPLSIKGIIDRVDIDTSHGPGGGRALVLDYKAGRLDRYEAILRHDLLDTSFQLPLYAAALLADRGPALSQVGVQIGHVTAGYYSLRQGRPSQGRLDDQQMISMDPAVQARAPAANVAEVAYRLWRRLRDGDFRVDPKSCEGCGLEAACRVSLVAPAGEDEEDRGPKEVRARDPGRSSDESRVMDQAAEGSA